MHVVNILLLLWSLPNFLAGVQRRLPSIDRTFTFYEDQVGAHDWHQNYIGKVTSVAFPRNRRTVFVATESGVVASLKMNSGKIGWRQVLPEGESLEFIISNNEYLLTLSEDGAIARLWLSVDGSLIWDTNTYNIPKDEHHIANAFKHRTRTLSQPKRLRDFDALFLNDDWNADYFVAILSKNKVVVRNEQDGKASWKWTADPTRNLQCLRLVLGKGEGEKFVLYVVCAQIQDLEQAIVIVSLDPWTGKILDETSEELPPSFSPDASNLIVLSSGIVLILKKEEASLIIIDLTTVVVKIVPHYLTGSPYTQIADIGMGSVFVMKTETEKTMFEVSPIPELAMRLVSTFPIRKGKNSMFNAPMPNVLANHLAHITQEKTSLSIEFMAKGSYDRRSIEIPFSGHGEIESVFVRGKDPYFLVVAADDSLTIIRNEKIISTREEALGSVESVNFVDIHTSEAQLHFAKNNKMDTFFVAAILQDLTKALVNIPMYLASKYGTPKIKEIMGITGTDRTIEGKQLEKDEFGFRKVILLTTGCGKLFGLNSLTGDIVWKQYLQSGDNTVGIRKDIFLIQPDRALYIDSSSSFPVLHYFNPTIGDFEQPIKLDYKILQANLLQIHDSKGNQLLMLVDTKFKVHILPDTDSAKKAFKAQGKNVYFYTADMPEAVIQGFRVTLSSSGFSATNLWTIAYPKDVEKISSIAARDADEVVQSAVRTLGPNEYKVKYLNPNLLAIATVRTEKAGLHPLPNRKITDISDPAVVIYLIDVVTGTILEKRVHRHGQGPVSMSVVENMVVYHFWNSLDHRYEISVFELYESETERKTSVLGTFEKNKKEDLFSSTTAQLPEVLQQSYIFGTAIKSLTATKTRRGITTRHFLVGLNSNQIMGIARNLLDPRRPISKNGKPVGTPTQFSAIPYTPQIPLDPLQIISYNITINNLRGVETSHAVLESTSLVFAYGVDLFFTRITPSQRFDLLSDDFNYLFLVLSVSAVFLAIAVTKKLENRKTLKESWK